MIGVEQHRRRYAAPEPRHSCRPVRPRGLKPAARKANTLTGVTRSVARRGYLLLEVMLALGLLVLGLATIGMQIQTSWETALDTHRVLRAMHLAESKLNELDAGLISEVESAVERDLEEEFGRLFPNFGWRLRIEPTQTPELWLVRLQILYQQRQDVEAEEFEFEDAEVLYTLRTLRATPATVNPQRDFGADDETMAQLTEALAGTELDPEALDLRLLAGMPIDDLLDLLAAFQGTGLLEGLDLAAMLPPDVLQLLQEAGAEEFGTSGLQDESEAEES